MQGQRAGADRHDRGPAGVQQRGAAEVGDAVFAVQLVGPAGTRDDEHGCVDRPAGGDEPARQCAELPAGHVEDLGVGAAADLQTAFARHRGREADAAAAAAAGQRALGRGGGGTGEGFGIGLGGRASVAQTAAISSFADDGFDEEARERNGHSTRASSDKKESAKYKDSPVAPPAPKPALASEKGAMLDATKAMAQSVKALAFLAIIGGFVVGYLFGGPGGFLMGGLVGGLTFAAIELGVDRLMRT